MRKSSTNRLFTFDFGRMCLANLLLFTSVYMLFPVLPFAVAQQVGLSFSQAGFLFLAFGAGLFAVGPFHAYLGDTYRRKSVLLYSIFVMLAAMLGYTLAGTYTELLLLALVQGACFGLATTAGITVAIDITASSHRSRGNMLYAWSARLGMLLGAGAGIWLFKLHEFRTVVYLAMACGLLGMYLTSMVYVAFRAPIGVSVCNIDRFLLLRAWLPALSMLIMACVAGLLLPLLFAGSYWAILALGILVILTIPFTKLFVRLSYHCQRGTANTTCHLSMDAGILIGLSVACHLMDTGAIYHVSGTVSIVALLFFLLLTYPYCKRKRVR